MIGDLVNPADSLERRAEKLATIAAALMRRVEQGTGDPGAAYAQFQRAAMLEDQVRDRTRDLERALDLLNQSNARLAEASRETEAARHNLATAIEAVQEGFALFDPQDRLVLCNARFCTAMEDVRAALHPGLGFSGYVDLVSRSARLALPPGDTPAAWARDRLRRHREGDAIFNVSLTEDRWLQVSERRTPDGGTVILQTNVTDLVRLEREARGRMLDDQARMTRATLDHLDQGVAIFDAGARLAGWNRRLGALLALPAGRLRPGLPVARLLAEGLRGLAFEAGMTPARLLDWSTSAERAPLSFALHRGEDLVLAAFAQGMPDGGFVISLTDISAERRAITALSRANETLEARVRARTLELEDALADAERANAGRSRFVAAASHDLLQPLSAAKLFLSAIDAPALPAEAQGALAKAQNALVSVETILGALLDISRLESGKAAVTVGPVDLEAILSRLREEFAPVAAVRGLRLTIRPAPVRVLSDAAYLRRILQNLIGNALRYTDRGRVLVAVRPRAGMLRIEVWDTGPGIPEPEQENIFREFHRLDAPASAAEGMGLGLAIVERACALLGHPLGLVSRVGRGSCFMVQVPRAPEAAGARPAPVPGLGLPPAPRRVLLVENDPDMARALSLLLDKWGMQVMLAATAEQALDLWSGLAAPPDAVLADQQLGPGMTGLDLARHLRARHPALALRLISADRSPALRDAAARAGLVLLSKPVDPAQLGAFLAQAAARQD